MLYLSTMALALRTAVPNSLMSVMDLTLIVKIISVMDEG